MDTHKGKDRGHMFSVYSSDEPRKAFRPRKRPETISPITAREIRKQAILFGLGVVFAAAAIVEGCFLIWEVVR